MSITTTSDRLEVIHDRSKGDGPESIDITSDPAVSQGATEGGAPEVQASSRPTFTITDAATACSVSRKTITRKLAELALHGAAKDDDGVWRIPVEALLAVGLHPGRSLPDPGRSVVRPAVPAPVTVRPVEQDTITIPRDRWDDVRIRLARAEAEASERGLALADARLALRALTAGPAAGRQAVVPGPDPERAAPTGSHADAPEQAASGATLTGVDNPAPGASVAAASPGHNVGAGSPSSGATSPRDVEVPELGQSDPGVGTNTLPADVAAARNLAARTGGYVPAGATPVKKRRWWQSR